MGLRSPGLGPEAHVQWRFRFMNSGGKGFLPGLGHLAQVFWPACKVVDGFVNPRGMGSSRARVSLPWSLGLPESEKGITVCTYPNTYAEYSNPFDTAAEEEQIGQIPQQIMTAKIWVET